MDTCIECHESREITTECTACHTTGMVPDSHQEEGFKTKKHGEQAAEDLNSCNQCHKDMSKKKLEGYEKASALVKLLKVDNTQLQNKNHKTYSRENTFCLDCHNKRPESHTESFTSDHGALASKNQETCSTCHDTNKNDLSGSNKVNCSSCHQNKHRNNWRTNHPIPVTGNQKPTESCYKCHVKKTCTNCHTTNRK